MTALKLIYNPICPGCRAVWMCSEILNLNLDLQEIDILNHDYMKLLAPLTPHHEVPVLQDGKFKVWDSHAINGYLVNKFGHTDRLYPKAVRDRALVDQKMYYDANVLNPLVKKSLHPILFRNQIGLRRDHMRIIKNIYLTFERMLFRQKWICGQELNIADLSCLASLSTLDFLCPIDEKIYPKTYGYIQCTEKLPWYGVNLGGLSVLSKIVQEKLIKYKNLYYV